MMPWWSGVLILAFLFQNNGVIQSQQIRPTSDNADFSYGLKDPFNNYKRTYQPSNSNIDIQFDNEPMEIMDGSGRGGFPSDDEDLGVSGSGSGSGFGDIDIDAEPPVRLTPTTTSTTTTTTTTPATRRPLSNCEKEKQRHQLFNHRAPDCLKNGDYSPLQCMDIPGVADCWCVDMMNGEIRGTRMEAPNIPSCDDGDNLEPCVFDLVQAYRAQRLGAFFPKCSVDGKYEKQQCFENICFCVDQDSGKTIPGTEVSRSSRPVCDLEPVKETVLPVDNEKTEGMSPDSIGDSEEEEIEAEVVDPVHSGKPVPEDPGKEIVFPDTPDDVNIDGTSDTKDSSDDDSMDDNKTGPDDQPEISKQDGEESRSSVQTAGQIMTQPGILAGIIGGSVVLLLCLVLLIMFIIYRMRKKDEGSYPLDEPRRPANYAYVRTPDREFYA